MSKSSENRRPAGRAEELIGAARNGSKQAIGELFELCRPYLLKIANRKLDPALHSKAGGSDLVQETFLEAQKDFDRFDGSRKSELLVWLRRILLNNLADFTRRYRKARMRDAGAEVSLDVRELAHHWQAWLATGSASPSSAARGNEQVELLERALAKLPEHYRRVIRLRHQENRTFKEIGDQLGRTSEAARKLWARAIGRLQVELKPNVKPK